MGAQTHPDFHLIYRQLNREHPEAQVRNRKALHLGVDVLRHFVIDKVGLTPARGRAKVFVIREANRITEHAQNALLKTLEEPPGTTFLILLVTSVEPLLPTTLSRCQVVRFDTLPTAFVRTELAKRLSDLPEEQIEWYARLSGGSIGAALQRADDQFYERNRELVEGLVRLSGGRSGVVVGDWTDWAKGLAERYRKRDPDVTETEATRYGVKCVFHLAANWYADVLRVGTGRMDSVVNATWKKQLGGAATRMDAGRAGDAVKRIVQAEGQLDLNANTQLCLEVLVNDLARAAAGEAASVA